jgi:hypothetical protein
MVSRIYARTRPPLRCHSIRVLTVTDLRNAELKGEGGRGVRTGKGERERRGNFVPESKDGPEDILKLGHIGKVNYAG